MKLAYNRSLVESFRWKTSRELVKLKRRARMQRPTLQPFQMIECMAVTILNSRWKSMLTGVTMQVSHFFAKRMQKANQKVLDGAGDFFGGPPGASVPCFSIHDVHPLTRLGGLEWFTSNICFAWIRRFLFGETSCNTSIKSLGRLTAWNADLSKSISNTHCCDSSHSMLASHSSLYKTLSRRILLIDRCFSYSSCAGGADGICS